MVLQLFTVVSNIFLNSLIFLLPDIFVRFIESKITKFHNITIIIVEVFPPQDISQE